MNNNLTFDTTPSDGTINFGVGQPSADLLPMQLVEQATERFFRTAQPFDLNYGARIGDERFRNSLANFLTDNYCQTVTADHLFLSGGISQALDLICSHFSKPGDTIIVEDPCYFLAFQIFIDHGLNLVGVPVDEHGIIIDVLESILAETKPALLYTIPSYQNPSGHVMSASRRKRLVELSQQHDFLVLADEVYQMLYYGNRPPDALGTVAESGTVFSLGSFSKILAPGLRLGWIQTSGENVQRLSQIGFISSGGSVNHFASHVVRSAIDMGTQQMHLEQLRIAYRRRIEAMDCALTQHLGQHATWNRPDGGYFFWLKLKKNTNIQQLRRKATEKKVGFQAGELFSCTGSTRNYIRLCFAHYQEDEIREGIARLGAIFD